MITDLAHTAVCVPDVDAAVTWYRDVLGLTVLSPPYRMEGDAIERDMGELVPSPVAVKAAIVGVDETDRVIEIIEYPNSPGRPRPIDESIIDYGFTHIALLCDDVTATRADLETKGVRFLVEGIADVAGVRTTWISDPWDNVLILIEKIRRPDRPYYRQF
ncbi:MAG TPA: VOC family protein [Acidimicrobiia bacterium]|nr:VOC family protein [Acidimicrobiia bacterium]